MKRFTVLALLILAVASAGAPAGRGTRRRRRTAQIGLSWGTITVRASLANVGGTFEPGEYAFSYLKRLSTRFRGFASIEGSEDEIEAISEMQVFLIQIGDGTNARHLDIGVEHRIGETLRWRAAFFDRRESDLFSARGLEVAIEHHGRSLTGWRLPTYARFDLRASRIVLDGARRVAVFAELVNVLNRQNFGLPRRPSAGPSIDF